LSSSIARIPTHGSELFLLFAGQSWTPNFSGTDWIFSRDLQRRWISFNTWKQQANESYRTFFQRIYESSCRNLWFIGTRKCLFSL